MNIGQSWKKPVFLNSKIFCCWGFGDLCAKKGLGDFFMQHGNTPSNSSSHWVSLSSDYCHSAVYGLHVTVAVGRAGGILMLEEDWYFIIKGTYFFKKIPPPPIIKKHAADLSCYRSVSCLSIKVICIYHEPNSVSREWNLILQGCTELPHHRSALKKLVETAVSALFQRATVGEASLTHFLFNSQSRCEIATGTSYPLQLHNSLVPSKRPKHLFSHPAVEHPSVSMV